MTPDPETTAIFEGLWDTRLAHVDAQLEKIANTAYWLGRKLARHEITRDDVNRRIANLCAPRPVGHDDWVPVNWAKDAADEGLHRGLVT